MFDCVLPTRIARHGSLYTRKGRLNISGALNLKMTSAQLKKSAIAIHVRITRVLIYAIYMLVKKL